MVCIVLSYNWGREGAKRHHRLLDLKRYKKPITHKNTERQRSILMVAST